jgi:hypothetical protein
VSPYLHKPIALLLGLVVLVALVALPQQLVALEATQLL